MVKREAKAPASVISRAQSSVAYLKTAGAMFNIFYKAAMTVSTAVGDGVSLSMRAVACRQTPSTKKNTKMHLSFTLTFRALPPSFAFPSCRNPACTLVSSSRVLSSARR
jgi:hypothetical protein